jgi:hypothetical protein
MNVNTGSITPFYSMDWFNGKSNCIKPLIHEIMVSSGCISMYAIFTYNPVDF